MKRILIHNTNQEKPNTCGSCKHTDNDLGLVALHCDLLCGTEDGGSDLGNGVIGTNYNDGKVRSWEKCCFKPSRYVKRLL